MASWHIVPTGLSIDAPLAFDDWLNAFYAADGAEQAGKWAMGDALAYGEDHFEDRYAQALSASRYQYGTLRNKVALSRRFPLAARTFPVSHSHYAVAASLPNRVACGLLRYAVKKDLDRDSLRDLKRRFTHPCPVCRRSMLKARDGLNWYCWGCEAEVPVYLTRPLTASDAEAPDLDAHAVERSYGTDADGDWLPVALAQARLDRRTINGARTDDLGIIEIYGLKRFTRYRVTLEEIA